MTKVITGKLFNTSFGKVIVQNDTDVVVSVGETVLFCGAMYSVKDIIPPTKPEGKFSIVIDSV